MRWSAAKGTRVRRHGCSRSIRRPYTSDYASLDSPAVRMKLTAVATCQLRASCAAAYPPEPPIEPPLRLIVVTCVAASASHSLRRPDRGLLLCRRSRPVTFDGFPRRHSSLDPSDTQG